MTNNIITTADVNTYIEYTTNVYDQMPLIQKAYIEEVWNQIENGALSYEAADHIQNTNDSLTGTVEEERVLYFTAHITENEYYNLF